VSATDDTDPVEAMPLLETDTVPLFEGVIRRFSDVIPETSRCNRGRQAAPAGQDTRVAGIATRVQLGAIGNGRQSPAAATRRWEMSRRLR